LVSSTVVKKVEMMGELRGVKKVAQLVYFSVVGMVLKMVSLKVVLTADVLVYESVAMTVDFSVF
jgi:hypothetical protein